MTDLRRRPENRGMMSLEYALENPSGVDRQTLLDAHQLLANWFERKLPLTDPQVIDWVHRVLGYFHDCYRGTSDGPYGRGVWAAESLTIDHERNPMAYISQHAGVHFIRKYYPDFVPTREDFEQAYWGSK
jgi:hypothetical protein